MNILKNEKGFTLIELVLIIVILGILAAVATIQFGNIIENSKDSAVQGAAGSYNASLAVAVNTLKALPTGGATGTFQSEVFAKTTLSGTGVVVSSWDGTNNDFDICSGGTTCTHTHGSGPACGSTSHRYVNVTYNPVTGALTIGAPTGCAS